jgi:hypothetical protein
MSERSSVNHTGLKSDFESCVLKTHTSVGINSEQQHNMDLSCVAFRAVARVLRNTSKHEKKQHTRIQAHTHTFDGFSEVFMLSANAIAICAIEYDINK